MTIYQTCIKCSTELPQTEEFFYHHPTMKSGFLGACKECKNLQVYSAPLNPRNTEIEYFNKKWLASEEGCHQWQGSSTKGYGTFLATRGTKRVGFKAHRWIYENTFGSIPDDMTIEHRCGDSSCVNPDHLSLMSGRENSRRGVIQQWMQKQLQRKLTVSERLDVADVLDGVPIDADELYDFPRIAESIVEILALEGGN